MESHTFQNRMRRAQHSTAAGHKVAGSGQGRSLQHGAKAEPRVDWESERTARAVGWISQGALSPSGRAAIGNAYIFFHRGAELDCEEL